MRTVHLVYKFNSNKINSPWSVGNNLKNILEKKYNVITHDLNQIKTIIPNKGDILIGALAKMHINRVDMEGTKALSQEVMLQDIGRVRQVSESPDGYLYAITEGTGLLVKLIPIR